MEYNLQGERHQQTLKDPTVAFKEQSFLSFPALHNVLYLALAAKPLPKNQYFWWSKDTKSPFNHTDMEPLIPDWQTPCRGRLFLH